MDAETGRLLISTGGTLLAAGLGVFATPRALFDDHGAHYVGIARGQEGLGARLQKHHQGKSTWSRFCWFAFDDVVDTDLDGWSHVQKRDAVESASPDLVVRECEALLIEVLGTGRILKDSPEGRQVRVQNAMNFAAGAVRWEQLREWHFQPGEVALKVGVSGFTDLAARPGQAGSRTLTLRHHLTASAPSGQNPHVSECRHGMVRAWCGLCSPRKTAPARATKRDVTPGKSAPRKRPQKTGAGSPVAPPVGARKQVERRERGLIAAEKLLAKAQLGPAARLAAAKARVATARAKLDQARRAADERPPPRGPGTVAVRRAPGRQPEAPLQSLTDRGTGASHAPLLDPDLANGLVWVLPKGSVFHRRDCYVIDGRTGAVSRRAAQVKAHLRRCEHCSPLA